MKLLHSKRKERLDMVYALAMEMVLRKAALTDLASIFQLYTVEYDSTYPDPTFSSPEQLADAIRGEKKLIFVAVDDSTIVASLIFLYDQADLLAKAGAAVVAKSHRGKGITQDLIQYGLNYIQEKTFGVDILYVTTRTVHKAAQVLTQNMGFKQLGIFPNVHKTSDYETHALAAMTFNDSLMRRYTDFEQHPLVYPLYNIVRENIELPEMKVAEIWNKKDFFGEEVPTLEIVDAKEFVRLRASKLKARHEIDMAFFPFHEPNILITSPSQNIEVFLYVNEFDKHCVVTGCKVDREVSFTDLFLKISSLLRDRGIRYIECIIRANRLNIIDKVIKARFLPCGYVPAFQLEDDKRYDYVVFSRSFEILDFNNIDLTGESRPYLKNYVDLWERTFLGDYFKGDL